MHLQRLELHYSLLYFAIFFYDPFGAFIKYTRK